MAIAVVFYPAVVVVDKALPCGQHIAAVECQGGELCRFVVEGQHDAGVAYLGFVQGCGLHHLGCLAVGLQCGERGAFQQGILCLCHAVACLSIAGGLAVAYAQVEQHLVSGLFGLGLVQFGQLQGQLHAVARCHLRQGQLAAACHLAVLHHFIEQVEVGQVLEGVAVGQLKRRLLLGQVGL